MFFVLMLYVLCPLHYRDKTGLSRHPSSVHLRGLIWKLGQFDNKYFRRVLKTEQALLKDWAVFSVWRIAKVAQWGKTSVCASMEWLLLFPVQRGHRAAMKVSALNNRAVTSINLL